MWAGDDVYAMLWFLEDVRGAGGLVDYSVLCCALAGFQISVF